MSDPTEQFSQTVRGSGGVLSTAATGTMQTDNYATGGGVSVSDAADYPVALNPPVMMQEINVTENSPDARIEIHTSGGSVFRAFAAGTLGSRDKWEVDKIVISDPEATGPTVSLTWAGE